MTTVEQILTLFLILALIGLLITYFLYIDLRGKVRYLETQMSKKVNESLFEIYRDSYGERLEKQGEVLDQLLDRMGLEVRSQRAATLVREKAQ